MARSVQWRRTASDLVSWRQDQGLEAVIYIVREQGPTAFLLKEEGVTKPVRAFLGDPHSCTCSEFRKDKDLCKHICWLLLKKFRIPREDPISWQKGLVEREINSILTSEEERKSIRNRPETARKAPESAPSSNGRPALEQREISSDDTCPICMEELLAKREPVTYCRYSCANSIHIKCMKIWAEHQTSSGEKTIKCPFCREDFGPHEYLREEYRNTVVPTLQQQRVTNHPGTLCRVCTQSPIQGKCYRCTACNEYHLCQKCFNTDAHNHHQFEFRTAPNKRWRPCKRLSTNGMALPSALVNNMMTRDLGDNDYDLLLQLESNANTELSQIPESVIEKLPMERVRPGSRYLAPGEQCCICLRSYQVGEMIRRLPCRHKYHKDCVDNWLLHQHPTCPIDGQVVWNSLTADNEVSAPQRPRRQRPPNRPTNNQTNSQTVYAESDDTSLQMPGIGIVRLLPQSAPSILTGEGTSIENSITRPQQNASSMRRTRLQTNSSNTPTLNRRNEEGDAELAAELGVNLGQLLRLDSYTSDQLSDTSSIDRELFGPFDNRVIESSPDQRPSVSTPQATLQSSTMTHQADLSAENRKRRNRNMTLAAQNRLLSYGGDSGVQVPSISTRQPVGVSTLFLGNPTLLEATVEPPLGYIVKRSTGVVLSQKKRTVSDAGAISNLSTLQIGDAAVVNGVSRTTKRKPASKEKHRMRAEHQPNLSLLELNGTRW